MIATTLVGGLGNQMFIYAMVRAMSLRNNVPMAFDTHHGFDADRVYKRSLELRNFCLSLPESSLETFDYPLGKVVRKLSSRLGRNLLLPHYRFIHETSNHFQKELLEQRIPDAYLRGNWCREDYFKDYSDIIYSDFQISAQISQGVRDELEEIRSLGENTVMVGIRRYQECKSVEQAGLILSKAYYDKAIDIVKQEISSPVFVIFCQDYEWARQNIHIQGAKSYFVRPKSGKLSTIEDLWLMKHMKHFIVSNSTYYWWGAWLANPVESMLVAPEKCRQDYALEGGRRPRDAYHFLPNL